MNHKNLLIKTQDIHILVDTENKKVKSDTIIYDKFSEELTILEKDRELKSTEYEVLALSTKLGKYPNIVYSNNLVKNYLSIRKVKSVQVRCNYSKSLNNYSIESVIPD